jgi:hypothetical protein
MSLNNNINKMENNEMSTKIEDLPVPEIEVKKTSDIKQNPIEEVMQKQETYQEPPKVVQSEKFSLFKLIKKEFNEENLFLLILFVILSISDINIYIRKIPYMSTYFVEESWTFVAFKSFIFLLIFIIGKAYLLPKIQI